MKTSIAFPLIVSLLLAGAVHATTDSDEPPGFMDEEFMEQMQAMHEQMEQLRTTEDPDARRELMQSHMEQMHEAMAGMQGMMMGGGMQPGSGMGGHSWDRGNGKGGLKKLLDPSVNQRENGMVEQWNVGDE